MIDHEEVTLCLPLVLGQAYLLPDEMLRSEPPLAHACHTCRWAVTAGFWGLCFHPELSSHIQARARSGNTLLGTERVRFCLPAPS